jgi:hypothetical protein
MRDDGHPVLDHLDSVLAAPGDLVVVLPSGRHRNPFHVVGLFHGADHGAHRGLGHPQFGGQLAKRLLWRIADQQPRVHPPCRAWQAGDLEEQAVPLDEVALLRRQGTIQ